MDKTNKILHMLCVSSNTDSDIPRITTLLQNPYTKVNSVLRDYGNSTMLINAAARGNYSLVVLLLQHGANVHLRDIDNNTALTHSLMYGTQAVSLLLLQQNSPIGTITSSSGNTLLHHCVLSKQYKVCQQLTQLVEQNINPNERNNNGHTPLLLAVFAFEYDECTVKEKHKLKKIINCLLRAGADPRTRQKVPYKYRNIIKSTNYKETIKYATSSSLQKVMMKYYDNNKHKYDTDYTNIISNPTLHNKCKKSLSKIDTKYKLMTERAKRERSKRINKRHQQPASVNKKCDSCKHDLFVFTQFTNTGAFVYNKCPNKACEVN